MKLWQKVYLFTILLFVIILNAGMYVVFEMTYQKDLVTEQNQAEAEYNMLSTGMIRSLQNMEQQSNLTDAKLRALLAMYEHLDSDTEIKLTLWRGDTCIYPKDDAAKEAWNISDDKNELMISGKEDKSIRIRGLLYEDQERFYLQYEKALTELDDVWDSLSVKYILISLGFSCLLALLLFIVLKNTMKPMAQLSKVVDDMAEGNMKSRAEIKGSDEVASLGRHFNRMADRIEENIRLIQQEADAKQEFVDSFAHELKSPLTSIYGFAEYVQKANVSEDERIQCMDYIMKESNRLLLLSYTLLNMAKIRNEEVVKENVAFADLQEQVTMRMQHLRDERSVTLTCTEGVTELYVNEVLTSSLLCNLIQNAIYACESGGTVTWGVAEQDDGIIFTVKDDGCGMSPEQLARVREPFYRVDKARSRGEGRTGLGLALCSNIADYHGGEMQISSELQKGTEVKVYFPK